MGGLCDGRDISVDEGVVELGGVVGADEGSAEGKDKGVLELDGVGGTDEVSEDGKEVDKSGEGDVS
jgi:hypothetical protein